MNKNITMSINVISMGMLMTIMSNFSVLRFIDSFYSCIATCLCQVNIPQMFDKWKPLFLFLSEMIFVTFQNTFIAQMSTCFEGKQTRLTNNLLRFNYEGAVVLWERECTYICSWRPYNISILSAMDIWWNFNSTKYFTFKAYKIMIYLWLIFIDNNIWMPTFTLNTNLSKRKMFQERTQWAAAKRIRRNAYHQSNDPVMVFSCETIFA